MNILVTGGVGYIGSAVVQSLIQHNYRVIVIDNLSSGKEKYVHKNAVFLKADLKDKKALAKIFTQFSIDMVYHLAAYKSVAESIKNPKKYEINITGTKNLLEVMKESKCFKIIFSSSAAVYGNPKYTPIDESHPLNPINFYGETKVECEKLIQKSGIPYVILRYFNVSGNVGLNYIDNDAEDVISKMMQAVKKKKKFLIFGNDYDTEDGTPVRDFIDLNDITKAHIDAMGAENEILNLGSGTGMTIKQLADMVKKLIPKFQYQIGPRREGDIAISVASNEKAKKILGWKPKTSIKDMIKAAWKAYSK